MCEQRGPGVAWGGNVFDEIVQEQSTAHLKPRDLSSKYVQIAGTINSLNPSKQLLPPSYCLAIVQTPEPPGTASQTKHVALVPNS